MSTKHNTKHNSRGPSNYPAKLREQGRGSVTMRDHIGVGKRTQGQHQVDTGSKAGRKTRAKR